MAALPSMQTFLNKAPPKFGRETREQLFALDPSYIAVNHGSFGLTPTPVKDYYYELSKSVDANPDLFVRFKYAQFIDEIRGKVARLIGAQKNECFFVPNVSLGLNTIMRNFVWDAQDVILATSVTHKLTHKLAKQISDTSPRPALSLLQLNFPTTHANIIAAFRAHIQSLVKGSPQVGETRTPTTGKGKIVAIIDTVVSAPGVALPWKEMVEICREYGVWSVVDGAHSIGQEQGLDLTSSQPDFWVSNCHKWLYSRRPSGVLYVPQRNQHVIKTTLPTSEEYPDASLEDQFVANSSVDLATYGTVGAALEFREWIGGEKKINDYCHNLVIQGSQLIAEMLGTEVLDQSPNLELTLNMANVILPISSAVPYSPQALAALKTKTLIERNAYGFVLYHNGKWMLRLCAQIYNELEDYEKIGRLFVEVCREVGEEFGGR